MSQPCQAVKLCQPLPPAPRQLGLWALLLGLGLGGCAAPPSASVRTAPQEAQPLEILPGASAVIPSLGTGWSTVAEDYMGRCVAGTSRRLPSTDMGSSLKITNNLQAAKAQQSLGFGLGTRAHFSIGTAAFKAQAAAAMSQDAFSHVWVFAANYVADAEEIDFDQPLHSTLIGSQAGSAHWQQECGDEFVYQVHKGAQLFLVYRLDFQSEALKNSLLQDMHGQVSILEVNAELQKKAESLAHHAQLTIEVYQFGGDPSKITGMITGPGASSQQANAAAQAVIRCGIDNLQACETFLTHALVYATSLQDPEAFPQQLQHTPSPMAYITMPWTRLGKQVSRSPDSHAVSSARLRLALTFDQVHSAKKRVELLLQSPWPDPRQREALRPWLLDLEFALGQIRHAVGVCYDDMVVDQQRQTLFSSATVARCLDAVAHVQQSTVLPPPQSLRGAVEQALAQRYAQEARRAGLPAADLPADPSSAAVRQGSALCIAAPGASQDSLCAAADAAGATQVHTTWVPERFFAAFCSLSAAQLQHACYPSGAACGDAYVSRLPFAPDGALIDNGLRSPALLYGGLLAYYDQVEGSRRLGVPRSHQCRSACGGGEVGHFDSGALFCRANSSSCQQLAEPVYAAWQAAGGSQGCLGLPREPREPREEAWLSCFQGGAIVHDPHKMQAPQVECPARWRHCR